MTRCLATILVLSLLAAGAAAQPGAASGLLVVANAEVPADTLSTQLLQRIFLGKTTSWGDGLTIQPVMLEDHAVHESFLTGVLDRSEESFSVYWKRMVFAGRGEPPLAFDTHGELADFLRSTPGAIGFLPAGADTVGLKIVTVD